MAAKTTTTRLRSASLRLTWASAQMRCQRMRLKKEAMMGMVTAKRASPPAAVII